MDREGIPDDCNDRSDRRKGYQDTSQDQYDILRFTEISLYAVQSDFH
jgi:hypothetical protein